MVTLSALFNLTRLRTLRLLFDSLLVAAGLRLQQQQQRKQRQNYEKHDGEDIMM